MANDDGSLDLTFLKQYPRRIVWGFPYLNDDEATGWFVWAKREDNSPRPMGNPCEMAYSTCWSGFHWKKFLWCGYMRENGEQRYAHPTQKPDGIMRPFIERYTETQQTILDPFMGSGSTLVAAKYLNRKAIGIEIEEKYCKIAVQRLAQEAMVLE